MHYSISIALKYLRTKRRRGFISRVTAIAIIGTLVGVATLIVVLSLPALVTAAEVRPSARGVAAFVTAEQPGAASRSHAGQLGAGLER